MVANCQTGLGAGAGGNRTEQAAPARFTVTEEHLKLLRKMRVSWNDKGWGAPAIDAESPYGRANVKADVESILGKYAGNNGVLRVIHLQTKIALQIALSTGRFETGTYERQGDDDVVWKKV